MTQRRKAESYMTPKMFRETRRRLGLSQAALAERIGRTQEMISHYETNKYPVPKAIAMLMSAMARALADRY